MAPDHIAELALIETSRLQRYALAYDRAGEGQKIARDCLAEIARRDRAATEGTSMTTLWSWRWTVARGWIWCLERRCDATNADAWLKQYQADEPGVTFVLADRQPRPLKAAA